MEVLPRAADAAAAGAHAGARQTALLWGLAGLAASAHECSRLPEAGSVELEAAAAAEAELLSDLHAEQLKEAPP